MNRIIIGIMGLVGLTGLLLISACGGGTSISDSPENATNRYQGTYQNNEGTQSGSVAMDIVEDGENNITGNIIFTPNGESCLLNSSISGTSNGFNLALTAEQSGQLFTITETATTTDSSGDTITVVNVRVSRAGSVGTNTSTSGDTTTVTETVASSVTGTMTIQLAFSGDRLSGTYVVSGDTCSNQSGSGSMVLSR